MTGDESGTGAEEESDPAAEQPGASSESVPSQPNRAPAAAAPALQAETRATANTFHIIWDNYFDVTVHYVDQYGSPIDYDFGCTNQSLTSGNTLNFTEFGESVSRLKQIIELISTAIHIMEIIAASRLPH